MNTAKETICFLILFAPYVWEVLNDRYGDLDKATDVVMRIFIGLGSSIIVWIGTEHSILAAGFMCFAIFFLLFDYTIAIVLKRPDPFSYLSQTTGVVDRIRWWVHIGPWWRFGIRFAVFALALVFYF